MNASQCTNCGFGLPRPHRFVLSLFLLFSFAASAAAETVFTLQVGATFTDGCPAMDIGAGGADAGAPISGTVRFRIDEDRNTPNLDVTVLAGSYFRVGPHTVPM